MLHANRADAHLSGKLILFSNFQRKHTITNLVDDEKGLYLFGIIFSNVFT